MVKIGILTLHRCINYGSYWQARCLAEGLRARGHEVVILDHGAPRIDRAEWRCALQPDRPRRSSPADRAQYRAKLARFFAAIATLPLSPPFHLDAPAAMPACELVVVGSDEVWNLSHPWYGHCALFYGEAVRAPRLVAYAASFGNHAPQPALAPAWADKLRGNFARISVRDRHSRAIVARATGLRPPLVLDPCLQFPLRPDPPRRARPRAPHVAVYGHGFSAAMIERARRWARRRALPLVSIGYRNDWADRQWLAAGPHEFAHFIAGADAVVTNFFHGCVFALRNGKPFVCEASAYRGTKLRCLMAELGGQRHLLADAAPADACEALLDAPPAPAMLARIARRRGRSMRFLDRALAAPAGV